MVVQEWLDGGMRVARWLFDRGWFGGGPAVARKQSGGGSVVVRRWVNGGPMLA
jgi:hypothetical protein